MFKIDEKWSKALKNVFKIDENWPKAMKNVQN
jgi:hypothetical protein